MSKSNHFGASTSYQAAQSALERQTAALLAERRQIENTYQVRQEPQFVGRPTQPQFASLTPVVHHSERNQLKTQEVVTKLQQIIKLCRQEGTLSNEQMREVVKVENQVLHYLQKTTAEPELQVERQLPSSEQVIKSKTNPPSFPSNSQMNETWGKEPYSKTFLGSDTLEIINEIEKKALREIIHLRQERDSFRKEKELYGQELERLRNEITRISSGGATGFNEANQRGETLQLERLRQENRQLKVSNSEVDSLRQQNKALRQENQYLHSRLSALGNGSVSNVQGRQTVKYVQRDAQQLPPSQSELVYGQYDSQIAVYENQLKRATVVINQLKSRLSHIPGLEQLHDQGERIRRQTSDLLRLKENATGYHSNEADMIRQLQERLEGEERGKMMFLEELRGFKQRYLELEEENKSLKKSKVSFDPVPKIGGSLLREGLSPRSGIMKKRVSYLGDYQQTLNQLKQVLY